MGTTIENASHFLALEKIMDLHAGDDPHDKVALRRELEKLSLKELQKRLQNETE